MVGLVVGSILLPHPCIGDLLHLIVGSAVPCHCLHTLLGFYGFRLLLVSTFASYLFGFEQTQASSGWYNWV